MASLVHLRPESDAEKIMAPLLALDPVQQIKKALQWGNTTDSVNMLAHHSGFKTLHSCGMKEVDGKTFEKSLDLWERKSQEGSGRERMYLFDGLVLGRGDEEECNSAWSHRDIGVWK